MAQGGEEVELRNRTGTVAVGWRKISKSKFTPCLIMELAASTLPRAHLFAEMRE